MTDNQYMVTWQTIWWLICLRSRNPRRALGVKLAVIDYNMRANNESL